MIVYALSSVVLVSLLSLLGIFTLSLKEERLHTFIFVVVSVSVGALFGDAFLHLLPDAMGKLDPIHMASLVLFGIISFFVLEKFLHWRHSHGQSEEGREAVNAHDHRKKPLGIMVLVSDGIHNCIDGLIIGASFMVGTKAGFATTIAIILHEIPHEIANFGLLLHSGFSKKRALFFNFLSAVPAILGTILSLLLAHGHERILEVILPIAAGTFIYIAGSDLVPELHKTKEIKKSLIQFFSIVIGLAVMYGLLFLE